MNSWWISFWPTLFLFKFRQYLHLTFGEKYDIITVLSSSLNIVLSRKMAESCNKLAKIGNLL
jgi:hypothetical protein